jgi:hypothetical protein
MNIRLVAVKKLMGDEDFYYRKDGTILPVNSVAVPSEPEIQAKIAELEAAEPMRLLRVERDRLIALTDWRFRSDLTPSQAWIDYCRALRDLPANSTPALDQNGNLTGVNWPTPPEN